MVAIVFKHSRYITILIVLLWFIHTTPDCSSTFYVSTIVPTLVEYS